MQIFTYEEGAFLFHVKPNSPELKHDPPVRKHSSPDDCWVIVHAQVIDVTSFLSQHPGGAAAILQLAGQDATSQFDLAHPQGTLESHLPASAFFGFVHEASLPVSKVHNIQVHKGNDQFQLAAVSDCLNCNEIEELATIKLSKKAWGYYFSAANDHISKEANNAVYRKILLRTRVFVDVSKCSTSATMLGNKVNMPLFVSPAAQARLGHPLGEHGIALACAKYGICQIISSGASQTPEEIVAAAPPDQIFGWQLYVNVDRTFSEKMLARIGKLAQIRFVVLTLDSPTTGKREIDQRDGAKFQPLIARTQLEGIANKVTGGVALSQDWGTACDLTPESTLPWLVKHTSLPIVLKGVQTHEDAFMACQYPHVKAMILSNHGGRSADTAPPSIHTLLEIRRHCPQVFSKVEIWIDGGIKRGSDIAKALALGARCVGIGRLPLYGLAAGGPEGVERVFEIVKGELETAMKLLGVQRVEQLGPRHVNARSVIRDIYREKSVSTSPRLRNKAKL